jgi:hypothetical protein
MKNWTGQMDIQRLRNLTTSCLHTDIGHVYEDLEIISGENGLTIHTLLRVARAVDPWLREHVKDQRFWDGKYDPTHTGEYALPEPTVEDRATMFERYKSLPNPLEGKDVIVVQA